MNAISTHLRMKDGSVRKGYIPQATVAEMEEIMVGEEIHQGFCTACGAYGQLAEPDARRYRCEECGEKAVYGTEELMIMGLVRIVDEEGEKE